MISTLNSMMYRAAADATVAIDQTGRAIKREHDRALAGEVSVEYVLIVALVIIFLIAGFKALAKALEGKLNMITEQLNTSGPGIQ